MLKDNQSFVVKIMVWENGVESAVVALEYDHFPDNDKLNSDFESAYGKFREVVNEKNRIKE